MRKLFIFTIAAAFIVLVGCSKETPTNSVSSMNEPSDPMGFGNAQNRVATYEIIIENLTPNNGNGASQPFSPIVVASHRARFHIFQDGKQASYELGRLAEDAQSDPLIGQLSGAPFVFDYNMGGGVVLPGETETLEVEARIGFRYLSLVSMLVNTNDGFVGADGLRLPGIKERGSVVHYLNAYDAGTEKNTELKEHIPGPCCGSPGVRVPENKRVMTHAGIQGHGDLDPATWGWDEPVAKVTITLKSVE
jgi:hypothetical protein